MIQIHQPQNYDIEVLKRSWKELNMRNLRNTRYDQWSPPSQLEGRPLTGAAWDLANDSVICAFGPSETDPLVQLVRVTANGDS